MIISNNDNIIVNYNVDIRDNLNDKVNDNVFVNNNDNDNDNTIIMITIIIITIAVRKPASQVLMIVMMTLINLNIYLVKNISGVNL